LRVDSRAKLIAGGDSGPAIQPGKPEESLLVEAINYSGLEMPPGGKLKADEIAVLTNWVKLGAPWPDDKPLRGAAAPAEIFEITEADRNHWAFRPVQRPVVPQVLNAAWMSDPLDAFVLARLEERGLVPNAPADRRTLIRRLYFDLIGLPPTPAEVAAFQADTSPDAYEKLVDALLAREQYGERWARHWLDVVRFGQTNGYERDDEKPNAWRYRDYVIRAFNQDKPYDRFILEQLAGDELDDVSHDSIIATGFYRLGVWDDEPDDRQHAELEEYDEMLRTAGTAFLGMTLGCARCHDHKFDPISQEDYYSLLAHFRNVEIYGKPKSDTHYAPNTEGAFTPLAIEPAFSEWKVKARQLHAELAAHEQSLESLKKPVWERLFKEKLAQLPGELKQACDVPTEQRTQDQQRKVEEAVKQATPSDSDVDAALDESSKSKKKTLEETIAQTQLALEKRPFDEALSVREADAVPPETFVLIRGLATSPGTKVHARLPELFGGHDSSVSAPQADAQQGLRHMLRELGVKPTTGLRRQLAQWIARPDNPLTARVMVNRLWQHHFGRGIVPTVDNFGRAGIAPSNSELLDWLASQFVSSGWSIKALHKQIVTSSTYRLSSRADNEQAMQVDPANDLHWRQNLRRLDAEAMRDSILAVSGKLNYEMGGRGVFPALSRDVLETQSKPGHGWEPSDEAGQSRRSIYIFIKRTLMVPLFEAFDYTNTAEAMGERPVTTVAPQALMLLNSDFLSQQAGYFADRVAAAAGDNADARIDEVFRLALQRVPTTAERDIARQLLTSQQQRFAETKDSTLTPDEQALRSLCLTVLNLNEFVYVD
jgi:hypothetical protein